MRSTLQQRRAARRALLQHDMKVDVVIDGEDELWTPRRADGVTGEAVRITPGMSEGAVEQAFATACRVLANG